MVNYGKKTSNNHFKSFKSDNILEGQNRGES